MKLRELFDMKDFKYRVLVVVQKDDTISTVIRKLIEHDRGSISVCNDSGELVEIITERDIVRKCLSHKDFNPDRTKVNDIMSRDVVIGNSDDDLDYAISVMKRKRIRHLPIVDNRKLIGMISMRDLLGVRLEESTDQIRTLTNYISGSLG